MSAWNKYPFAKKLRYRIEYLGLWLGVSIIERLPYAALRHLANFLGGIVYSLDSRSRAVSLANLEAAFPGKYSQAEKERIARDSLRTFARSMLELFWSPNVNQAFVDKMFRHEGKENDPYYTDPAQAVIYPSLHLSNYEWLGQSGCFEGRSVPVIAQKFKNPLIGPLFDRARSFTGNFILRQERAMIKMFKHVQSGGKFGMLCDLNLHPDEGSVVIDVFNGLKVSVTQTHAALALRTGAKIVPVGIIPEPDGGYRLIHHKLLEYPPGTTAQEIVQMCWDTLEPTVHEHPELWLWSYKHWRFKPGTNGERYPFYALVTRPFEKLIDAGSK